MEIITGKTGTAHVQSADDRALHASIFGSDSYILNNGSKLSASITSSNSIAIADGDLMAQGCHARIRYGESETVAIETGTVGYNRKDLIVARYTNNADIESIELAVIKGSPTTGTATAPAYTEGNILTGSSSVDIPLYEVNISGVTILSVTRLLAVQSVNLANAGLASAVTKAQTTANTAVTNAATAQSTANGAMTEAKLAEELANSATSKANTAITRTKSGYVILEVDTVTVDITYKSGGTSGSGSSAVAVPTGTIHAIPVLISGFSSVTDVSATVSSGTATVKVSAVTSSTLGATATEAKVKLLCIGKTSTTALY